MRELGGIDVVYYGEEQPHRSRKDHEYGTRESVKTTVIQPDPSAPLVDRVNAVYQNIAAREESYRAYKNRNLLKLVCNTLVHREFKKKAIGDEKLSEMEKLSKSEAMCNPLRTYDPEYICEFRLQKLALAQMGTAPRVCRLLKVLTNTRPTHLNH
ncbi:hypothetical protein RUND412_009366 [Rhizina undulata]